MELIGAKSTRCATRGVFVPRSLFPAPAPGNYPAPRFGIRTASMQLISRHRRRDLGWLFLIALVVIGAGIGLRDPWPADEPRFTLVAKQMVEDGHWLFPHRGEELYSDKPPTYMWTQAAASLVIGSWRIGFLLPSLLAALGTLWLVYDLTRRLRGHRVGLYAAYALMFTLHFTFQAKKAQIDPSVVFWITLSAYGLLRHLLTGPDWRMYALAFFAAGVGTITKGVGALALLLLVPYAFARWRGMAGLAPIRATDWRWLTGPPLFVLALTLWLGPMLYAVHASNDPALDAYMQDILFRQTAKRYTQSWDHHQPPYYYLGIVLGMWLPLMLSLPWAAPSLWRRIRRGDARTFVPLAWAALIVLFFSFPQGKRDVYILPALPLVCVAFAPLLPGILRRAAAQRLAFGFALLLGVLALAGGAVALLGEPAYEARLEAQRGFDPESTSAWWLLVTIGGSVVLSALALGMRRGVAGLHAGLACLWMLFGFWGYPLLNASSSARGLMEDAGRRIGPDAELALVAWKEQNLLQTDRPAKTFGFLVPWDEQLRRAIAWQAEAPEQRWVFVLEQAMGDCIDRERAEIAGRANRRTWWLFKADAVRAGCTPGADPRKTSTS